MTKKQRTYNIRKHNREFLDTVKEEHGIDKSEMVDRAIRVYKKYMWNPDNKSEDPWLEGQVPKEERR